MGTEAIQIYRSPWLSGIAEDLVEMESTETPARSRDQGLSSLSPFHAAPEPAEEEILEAVESETVREEAVTETMPSPSSRTCRIRIRFR